MRPGIDWAVAALEGHEDQSVIAPARRKLAVEAADVAMTTQLAYDTSPMQSAVRHITRLRIYVLSLMPVLSSISDRVTHLRRMEAITPALQSVLDETAGWVKAGGPEKADALLAQIAALEEDGRSWAGLLRASLAVRLDELVQHHRGMRGRSAGMCSKAIPRPIPRSCGRNSSRHRRSCATTAWRCSPL